MKSAAARQMRIVLLFHAQRSPAATQDVRRIRELTLALRDRDLQVSLLGLPEGDPDYRRLSLTRPPGRVTARALECRGFDGQLRHVPATVAALLGRRYDLAHSFSSTDALAAQLGRKVTGRPVVFTCLEPLVREHLSDRRQRLGLLRQASENCDAIVAATPASRRALERWLSLDAPVIALNDVSGHERIYRELLSGRG